MSLAAADSSVRAVVRRRNLTAVMNRPPEPTDRPAGRGETVLRRPFALWAVRLLIVWHVAAIVIGPSSVPPSSGVQRRAWTWVGPYLQPLFLNHGYHFFAPDPGESTLVRFVAVREDGSEVRGQMPSLDDSWPRLLYHRDFMLTEGLPRMDGASRDDRGAYLQALADGLGMRHEAMAVTLFRVTHNLPTEMAVRAGFPDDDAAQFVIRELGTFACRR